VLKKALEDKSSGKPKEWRGQGQKYTSEAGTKWHQEGMVKASKMMPAATGPLTHEQFHSMGVEQVFMRFCHMFKLRMVKSWLMHKEVDMSMEILLQYCSELNHFEPLSFSDLWEEMEKMFPGYCAFAVDIMEDVELQAKNYDKYTIVCTRKTEWFVQVDPDYEGWELIMNGTDEVSATAKELETPVPLRKRFARKYDLEPESIGTARSPQFVFTLLALTFFSHHFHVVSGNRKSQNSECLRALFCGVRLSNTACK
jgi:hypothetical protein